MKRVLPLFLLVLLLLPSILHATLPFIEKDGETIATFALEIRPHWELDGRDFNDDSGMSDYGSMRSTIGIDVTPIDNFMVRFRLQESRFLGTQPPGRLPNSYFDVHEAYFRLDDLLDAGIAVQAGRFTFQTGRGRIYGYDDWNLFGPNAFDGIQIEWPCILAPETGRWTLLAARIADFDYGVWLNETQSEYEAPIAWNPLYEKSLQDRNLIVLSGSFMNGVVQPFASVDFDGRDDSPKFLFDFTPKSRYHAGIYVGDTWDAVSFNVDAVYQWGELNEEWIEVDETGREIGRFNPTLQSWLLAADVAYAFDLVAEPTLKFGFDRTDGTWDYVPPYTAKNFPYFTTPFGSNRDFRGHMNVDWMYIPKLTDLFASMAFRPFDGSCVDLTYHRFLAVDEGLKKDRYIDIGHEIDVEMTWQVNEYLELGAGYATFIFTHDNYYGLNVSRINDSKYGGFANYSDDSADYGWLQATVRF